MLTTTTNLFTDYIISSDSYQLLKKRFYDLFIILLQIIFCVTIVVGISIVTYTLWYRRTLPRLLIEEKVYFDFSQDHPTASISLISPERQWEKLVNLKQSCAERSSDLIRGKYYDISVSAKLSKSLSNMALAKTSLQTRIIDCNGQTIAQSIRPLVIPYQSGLSLQLESVLMFPARFTGYLPKEEYFWVDISLMDNYQEPFHTSTLVKAQRVELQLHNVEIDLMDMLLRISPRLTYISYLLKKFPIICFIIGTALITLFQIALYSGIVMIALAYSALSSDGEDRTDRRTTNIININNNEIIDERIVSQQIATGNDTIYDSTSINWRSTQNNERNSSIFNSYEEEEEEDVTSFHWRKKNE